MSVSTYPVKAGDWLATDGGQIARVSYVHDRAFVQGDTLVNLVMYTTDGRRLGRTSPAEGGPTTFEPCCSLEGWHRISPPKFPLILRWLSSDDGTSRIARYDAGAKLPWREWKRPTPSKRRPILGPLQEDPLRKALELIAAGHNDARRIAQEALGYTSTSSILDP